MQIQHVISDSRVYSFETEDFEEWQMDSLVVEDEEDWEYSEYAEEKLAGNVVEFLKETADK